MRDTAIYLLGFKADDNKPENTQKRFDASKELHLSLRSQIGGEEFEAVCKFFEGFEQWKVALHQQDPKLFLNSGVFQLRGSTHFVHETPEAIAWWRQQQASIPESTHERYCLVTGERSPIALTHVPPIGGNVPGAQAKAPLVSFNFRSADSYGNNSLQGLNSPVSTEASVSYCKALNALLTSDKHRLQIGDATTVFWTETPTATESALNAFFGGEAPVEDGANQNEASQATNLLTSLQQSIRSVAKGGKPEPDISNERDVPFYILGLTGQAGGRIGIRFWHRSNVGELLRRLGDHHRDLAIAPQWRADSQNPDPEFPPIWMLLRQTGRESKDVPPSLGGALMRSILEGTPYPVAMPKRVLGRVRVTEKDKHDKSLPRVNYFRAAILKAFLNRNHHLDMNEALDKNRSEPPYHLGRLFAVYETAQKHAHDWKLERTIRETMYSSASATPLAVFGRLERLHHHHTAKKSHPRGSPDSYAQIVGEIEQNFRGPTLYPASLNLVEQSLFAVGYYHQLHWFQSKSDDAKKEHTKSEAGRKDD